jgi:hypothetical protein
VEFHRGFDGHVFRAKSGVCGTADQAWHADEKGRNIKRSWSLRRFRRHLTRPSSRRMLARGQLMLVSSYTLRDYTKLTSRPGLQVFPRESLCSGRQTPSRDVRCAFLSTLVAIPC